MTLPMAPGPMTTKDLSLKAKAMLQVLLEYIVPVATSYGWPDLTLRRKMHTNGKTSSGKKERSDRFSAQNLERLPYWDRKPFLP